MPVLLTKRLLTAKEAGTYLGISRAKVYQMVDRKKLRSIKLDSARRFDVLDLDEFIEKIKTEQNGKS